ncbi:MAG: phosphatidate cytidylyltransferase [Oscillospiraceae bacterium]|nr:phosphatidate cytidylyltransferase [Oscillospiraceae bacterium]
MKTRIIVAAILLPVFFAILFIFPPVILTFVISVISAIAAHELLCAVKIINKRVFVYTIIAAAFTPLAVYISNIIRYSAGDGGAVYYENLANLLQITMLLAIFFIFICELLIEFVLTYKSKKAIQKGTQLKFFQIPVALAAGMLIPFMLSALVSLKTMPYGHLFVLLPIIAAFMTDSGAYFIGVTMGKTKAFPTISPNKTIEGCVGGVIVGTLGMLIYGIILSSTTSLTVVFPALILYGIIGAVITEFGDLVFSFFKRKCGIKDYGKIMPGHGGALDRFDSMTFCAPVMYLLVLLVPAVIY